MAMAEAESIAAYPPAEEETTHDVLLVCKLLRADRDEWESLEHTVSVDIGFEEMQKEVLKEATFVGNIAITFEDEAGENLRLNKRNMAKVFGRMKVIGQTVLALNLVEHDLEGNQKIRDKLMVKQIAQTQGVQRMNECYFWGDNRFGQLGINNTLEKIEMATENVKMKKDWMVFLACGPRSSAALNENREVLTWGDGQYGNLGQSGLVQAYSLAFLSTSTVQTLEPNKVKWFDQLEEDNKVWWLSVGEFHMAALTEQGEVYTWGGETAGLEHGFSMLGLGKITDWVHSAKSETTAMYPQQVTALEKHFIMKVECGSFHTCAMNEFGEMFTWGIGRRGQLGHGDHLDSSVPRHLECFHSNRVVGIAAGYMHTACIVNNGEVYTFGAGDMGQLGHGTKEDLFEPESVKMLQGLGCVLVRCGYQHSGAIDKYCNVYTWGEGDYYRLGHGDEIDATLPRQVTELDDFGTRDLQLGMYHSVALTTNEVVYSWGSSAEGQLGHADKSKQEKIPRVVDGLEGKGIRQIAVGGRHSCALSVDPLDAPIPPSKRDDGLCNVL